MRKNKTEPQRSGNKITPQRRYAILRYVRFLSLEVDVAADYFERTGRAYERLSPTQQRKEIEGYVERTLDYLGRSK